MKSTRIIRTFAVAASVAVVAGLGVGNASSAAAATSSLSCTAPGGTGISATGTATSNTWTAPGMFYNTVKLTAKVTDYSSTINMRVTSLSVTTYAGQTYTIYPASTGYNTGSKTFAGPGAVVYKVAMNAKVYKNGTSYNVYCANYQ